MAVKTNKKRGRPPGKRSKEVKFQEKPESREMVSGAAGRAISQEANAPDSIAASNGKLAKPDPDHHAHARPARMDFEKDDPPRGEGMIRCDPANILAAIKNNRRLESRLCEVRETLNGLRRQCLAEINNVRQQRGDLESMDATDQLFDPTPYIQPPKFLEEWNALHRGMN